jgi:hypothetical protein
MLFKLIVENLMIWAGLWVAFPCFIPMHIGYKSGKIMLKQTTASGHLHGLCAAVSCMVILGDFRRNKRLVSSFPLYF